MNSPGSCSNWELTERQLGTLKQLGQNISLAPLDGNHSRTLRSLARKGFAKRKEGSSRYFITDAGVDRLGSHPHNATRSQRGTL